MPNTTNYSWATPADTDLVKDGAAAIRTLGSAIDTTVFTNAAAAISKSLIDAEGDLIVGDAADAVQRLAIGSNGNVLTVDTAVDGKIKWAAPAAAGKVLQVVQMTTASTTSTSSSTKISTGLTLSITPSAASSKILVLANTMFEKSSGNAQTRISANITRGATEVWLSNNTCFSGTAINLYSPWSAVYLDSPNTTSATTYTINFGNSENVASVTAQAGGTTGVLILAEIGA
jgi:hypothetical protein